MHAWQVLYWLSCLPRPELGFHVELASQSTLKWFNEENVLHPLFVACSTLSKIHAVLLAPNLCCSDAIDSGQSKSLHDSCWDILDLWFLSNYMAILAPWDTSDDQNHVQNNVGAVSIPPGKSGHPSWRRLSPMTWRSQVLPQLLPPGENLGLPFAWVQSRGVKSAPACKSTKGFETCFGQFSLELSAFRTPDSLNMFSCLKDT